MVINMLDKTNDSSHSAAPRAHSEICQCAMCMTNRLNASDTMEHEQGLKSSMVDRRNPDDPVRPLMKATAAHSIIKAGTSINMLEILGLDQGIIPRYDMLVTSPQELTLPATWKNKSQEAAKSGESASVFGSLGVLLVRPSFNIIEIPKMNALAVPQSFLKKYGAELIALDSPIEMEPTEHEELENLYLVQYDFDEDYIEQYVMHAQGGGGLFVETHPFPHVFTPLSPDCGGALILGVDRGDGGFDFASFVIPFGFTMKIASNVIHGDSFFVGPYAIALTDTELADSVIFKQENPTRDIQPILQRPVIAIKLPILAEYRLARAVNFMMMIEKMRHDPLVSQRLNFFQPAQKVKPSVVEELTDDKKREQSLVVGRGTTHQ